jgi:hypothetical protein
MLQSFRLAEDGTDRLQTPTGLVNGRKKYVCRLLAVHGVNSGRHAQIQTVEPLVRQRNPVGFETAVRSYKSPNFYQTLAELM